MNNEPVAWINREEGSGSILDWEKDPYSEVNIPLYTHPVKELDRELLDKTIIDQQNEIKDLRKNLDVALMIVNKPKLTDEEIIESLAELEHEQWMKWADTIMQTEKISDARFARWASCMIPYADLTEEMKEFDREWARKALAILRKASEK